MNWEAIGAIGELTGAFAVVVSLIYVGVQVRHSAGAVRSAAANDASVAMQNGISKWEVTDRPAIYGSTQ